MEITVNINAPELANAINALAEALHVTHIAELLQANERLFSTD